MDHGAISEKSLAFAVRIVNLRKYLTSSKKRYFRIVALTDIYLQESQSRVIIR